MLDLRERNNEGVDGAEQRPRYATSTSTSGRRFHASKAPLSATITRDTAPLLRGASGSSGERAPRILRVLAPLGGRG
jgi:hypothetical protein